MRSVSENPRPAWLQTRGAASFNVEGAADPVRNELFGRHQPLAPRPPAEADLVDLGPLIAVWWILVVVLWVRHEATLEEGPG